MPSRKRRHLSPAGFLLALALLIAAIFAADGIARMFLQTNEENIVGIGGFSTADSSAASADNNTTDTPDGNATQAPASDETVLQLTADQMKNGPLILADTAHPYQGSQSFSDFSAITDENVKVRSSTLPIQQEAQQDLCSLFDAYAAANGWANLQIYSTTDTTLDASSIYTNVLPDRNTGYGFDIGLITSTGEVVPYIKKHNEWMVTNAWQYGFVVRYPSDKTETTGIAYAPHHFRYVGKLHAAIMHDNGFCLEEYISYLKNYTLDSGGLSYTLDSGSYTIYYVPADASGTTTVTLPKDAVYTVSGDNQSGYILTVTNTAASTAASASEDTAVQTTESLPTETAGYLYQ